MLVTGTLVADLLCLVTHGILKTTYILKPLVRRAFAATKEKYLSEYY